VPAPAARLRRHGKTGQQCNEQLLLHAFPQNESLKYNDVCAGLPDYAMNCFVELISGKGTEAGKHVCFLFNVHLLFQMARVCRHK
jgi:hypothetical protein